MRNSKYYTLLTVALVTYFGVSKLIFNKIYNTIQTVVDELYHLPQGMSYCNHNFTYWNEKITTPPGLYLVSTAFVSPYLTCNIYNLRFVNLLASCINLLLFSSMLRFIYGSHSESPVKIVLQALNLTILPPMYFFSHIYYTDTLSMTFLLAFYKALL
ncbi:unnamed protein product [Parnassius mnemosyne]|uniref:Dol-P-Glc:Glc(2)Man(9)GlcNAc(2)-PP-Dol alpha-1,2-glucosyltransferase n=1 Tax=Parnassius mnemosyne TaxID=213953 RepID=A0AAV1LRH1_9NEOP